MPPRAKLFPILQWLPRVPFPHRSDSLVAPVSSHLLHSAFLPPEGPMELPPACPFHHLAVEASPFHLLSPQHQAAPLEAFPLRPSATCPLVKDFLLSRHLADSRLIFRFLLPALGDSLLSLLPASLVSARALGPVCRVPRRHRGRAPRVCRGLLRD